jgi:Ca-activated chloride channel family protein
MLSITRRGLLCCPLLLAQESPTIRVDVRLIRIFANVKDRNGQLVGGLERGDFRVFDNGVEQEIAVFERTTSQALRIFVLLDISASVAKDLKYETGAALRFARAVIGEGNPEDSIGLITFNHNVNLAAGFTRRIARLEHAIGDIRTGAGTSLYDAVYLAGEEMEGRDGRKVIVLVSDGGDTASFKKFNDAMVAAQRAQAAVYPILVTPILNDPGRNVGGENAMQLMAERTGGRVLLPGSFEQLSKSFDEILRDLRTQYSLAYYPRGVSSKGNPFHQLDIQVRREGLKVQARTGYYEETL